MPSSVKKIGSHLSVRTSLLALEALDSQLASKSDEAVFRGAPNNSDAAFRGGF